MRRRASPRGYPARRRGHPRAPPGPGAGQRVAHEDARGGALADLAAGDGRRGGITGRGAASPGTAACGRRVAQVMAQEPSRAAARVFWIVDHGSSQRGDAAARAWQERYPHLIRVHLPVQASWRNQIASSFAIVQRTVLPPTDCADVAAVAARLGAFAALSTDTAVPFTWRFTRADLAARLADLPIDLPTATALPEAASPDCQF